MDDDALSQCLEHLQAAEQLMVERVDGWHLARLSHVIESLKEAYGPRLFPAIPTTLSLQ